jgi:hypothetical protein
MARIIASVAIRASASRQAAHSARQTAKMRAHVTLPSRHNSALPFHGGEEAVPQPRSTGFALIDVLVALLLLAVCLTGACATLIQTMRTTHEALLVTRAVDLAADLTEDLRGVQSVTQGEAVLAAWREQVRRALPVVGLDPDEIASLAPMPAPPDASGEGPGVSHELVLRWRGSPNQGIRELRLPLYVDYVLR